MKNIPLIIASITILNSCTKNEIPRESVASLNVINAILDGTTLKLNTAQRDSVKVNSSSQLGLVASHTTTIKLSPTNDSTTSYYNQVQSTEGGGIYSLFLAGPSSAPEAVFVKDQIPAFATDSIIRVRIINLCNDIDAVDITLNSNPGTIAFSDINYKSLTDFKVFDYNSTYDAGANIFEIRNNAGTVLTSYTLPDYGTISIQSSRFRNITLVIKGQAAVTSGPNALGVFAVANY